jgi:hypothetical protein
MPHGGRVTPRPRVGSPRAPRRRSRANPDLPSRLKARRPLTKITGSLDCERRQLCNTHRNPPGKSWRIFATSLNGRIARRRREACTRPITIRIWPGATPRSSAIGRDVSPPGRRRLRSRRTASGACRSMACIPAIPSVHGRSIASFAPAAAGPHATSGRERGDPVHRGPRRPTSGWSSSAGGKKPSLATAPGLPGENSDSAAAGCSSAESPRLLAAEISAAALAIFRKWDLNARLCGANPRSMAPRLRYQPPA